MKRWLFAVLFTLLASIAHADLYAGMKLISADSMVVKQVGDKVLISLKVGIENPGTSGNVSVHVIGKNDSGFELTRVLVSGFMEAGQTKDLTTTTILTEADLQQIKSWQVVKMHKYEK